MGAFELAYFGIQDSSQTTILTSFGGTTQSIPYNRDFGEYFESKLSWSAHNKVDNYKAQRMSYWTFITFRFRQQDNIIPVFNSFARNFLCVESLRILQHLYSLHIKQNITRIESPQNAFIKIVKGITDRAYRDHFKPLNLYTLQRHLRELHHLQSVENIAPVLFKRI